MPGVFNPPMNPAFPFEIGDRWRTQQTEFESGYVQMRPEWPRKRRRFTMTWDPADQDTVDYVRGFVERQLGAANAFSWLLPVSYLYQPRPALAPALWYFAGGALALRTYYVVFTWVNASGATQISPQDSITIPASNRLRVQVPRFPAGVTSANVYASTTSGSETLQGSITTSNGIFDEPASGLVAGAAFPTVNTLAETLTLHFVGDTLKVEFVEAGVWRMEIDVDELLA